MKIQLCLLALLALLAAREREKLRAVAGEIQHNFYYFGNMNMMLAKMIRGEQIYFTE